jgi:hypothetical protein
MLLDSGHKRRGKSNESDRKNIDNVAFTPSYDPHENKVPNLGNFTNGEHAFELSASAVQFLNGMFTQFAIASSSNNSSTDGNKTNAVLVLETKQLHLIFHICPKGQAPWETFTRQLKQTPSSFQRSGWLAMWSLVVHFDPHQVMRYMWYLGYLGDSVKPGESVHEMHLHWPYNRLHVARAIRVTQPRSKERWVRRLDRNVVRCWVIGHPTESGLESLFNVLNQNNHRISFSKSTGEHGNSLHHLQNGNHAAEGYFSTEHHSIVMGNEMPERKVFNTIDVGSNGLHSTPLHTNMTAVMWYPKASTTIATTKEVQKDSTNNDGKTSREDSSSDNKWNHVSTHWVRSKDRALVLTNYLEDERECDVALFVFDPSNMDSLKWLKIRQSKLPGHIPCRYIALERTALMGSSVSNKSHEKTKTTLKAQKAQKNIVYAAAKQWCTSLELEAPTKLSATKQYQSNSAFRRFLEQVVVSGLEPTSCRPKSPERIWEDQKRRALLYAYAGLGVAVAVGAALLVRRTVLNRKHNHK